MCAPVLRVIATTFIAIAPMLGLPAMAQTPPDIAQGEANQPAPLRGAAGSASAPARSAPEETAAAVNLTNATKPSAPAPKISDLAAPLRPAGLWVAPVAVLSNTTQRPAALPPPARPKSLAVFAPAQALITPKPQSSAGSVCGRAGIKGKPIKDIPAKLPGCGLQDGVQVTSVSGVKLSTPANVTCDTARALETWIDKVATPVLSKTGGGLVGLHVAASYSCRTRNNQAGAKVSEHGRGRAIDIAAVRLANGQSISVLEGWKNQSHRALLEKLHKGACGPFGTVLGPKADRYHQDHFHFDIARSRGNTYCR